MDVFKKIYYNLVGCLLILLLCLNTVVGGSFLIPVSILKLVIRVRPAQRFFTLLAAGIAHSWMRMNLVFVHVLHNTEWLVDADVEFSKKKSYLIISNHQTWTDIIVIMKIILGRVPLPKFFLKKELRWIPVLGIAWWALGYPFMKRYSKELIEKKPHLKGRDIEITREACENFRGRPVTVMNFVEGTRFTPEKHKRQKSPFRRLLRPKAGGVGFVFSAIGEQIDSILNFTIAYPGGPYSFWQYVCGGVKSIMVHIQEIPVTPMLLGDYVNDPAFSKFFQKWINDLWKEKDVRLEQMLKPL